jgi:hypothetical protein
MEWNLPLQDLSSRKPIKTFLQRKCSEILQVVDSPENDHSILTHTAKIRMLAEGFKKFYKRPEALFFPTLLHLNLRLPSAGEMESRDFRLICNLVARVIDSKTEESTRHRAQFTLELLSCIDPAISRINHEISSFLTQDSQKSLARLQHFASSDNAPISIHYPIKPYRPSRHNTSASSHVMDFWKIKEIYLTDDTSVYWENLKEIGAMENFQVKTNNALKEIGVPWLRDVCLLLENNEILIPHRIPFFEECRSIIDTLINGSLTMGWVAKENVSSKILNKSLSGIKEAPFYFEGGNLIPAMNSKGQKVYLSGAHNILFSLLNAHILFSSKKEDLLKKMNVGIFNVYTMQSVYQKLEKTKLLETFSDPKEKVFIVKLVCTIIEELKKSMNESLRSSVLVLGDIFDAMPHFHLDLFLASAPFPPGGIYMNDFLLGKALLENILKNQHLTPFEEQQLSIYCQSADDNYKRYGTLLAKIRDQLKVANFKVISIPGICYGRQNHLSINLMNSVFGVGKNGAFCITNGSCHPVDRFLRSRFVEILKENGIDNVYFTGRDSTGPISSQGKLEYTTAQKALTCGGGIRCCVQEINGLFKGPFFEASEEKPLSQFTDEEEEKTNLTAFFHEMLKLKIG